MSTLIGSKIIYDAIDEIDSFESQYKNVILRNNNLVVPYINIGLSNHPLHDYKGKLRFIDFSYIVLLNVSYLKIFIGNPYCVIDLKKTDTVYYFGGEYLDYGKKIFNDIEVCCTQCYLQTLEFSRLGEENEHWISSDISTYKQNMDSVLVNDFFEHKYVPENIRKLIA